MTNETLGGMNRIFKGRSGTFTINETTPVVVSNKLVTSDSVIPFTVKTAGGTPAAVKITSKTAGTGFTVVGTAGDTSVYSYVIIL